MSRTSERAVQVMLALLLFTAFGCNSEGGSDAGTDGSSPFNCMAPRLYNGIQIAVEQRALDFAQCSVDGDCALYQVDLSCSNNLDVAVSNSGLEEFKKAIPALDASVCNIPCSYTNGSDAITAGCVDNLCKVTKWGI